jgi:hypothetical protein
LPHHRKRLAGVVTRVCVREFVQFKHALKRGECEATGRPGLEI